MKKFNMIDESFICEICGKNVDKLNYTARDHCKYCLCSKHLDNNPGNNNINNLEWLSHKDNLEYGLLYGNRDINELGQFCSKKK